MSELMLDAAGRRRSPATMPEFHAGRPPRNKGMRYPADPPTIEEIVTVMRARRRRRPRPATARPDRRAVARRAADPRGARARRSRSRSASRFAARPPRQGRPAPRGRHGRLGLGAARALAPGAASSCKSGPLFCVVNGPTRGRPWAAAAARCHPVVDYAWHLMHSAWRIDATHDQLWEDFRAARGDARRPARGRAGHDRRTRDVRLDPRPQRGHPPRSGRTRLGPRRARLVGATRASRTVGLGSPVAAPRPGFSCSVMSPARGSASSAVGTGRACCGPRVRSRVVMIGSIVLGGARSWAQTAGLGALRPILRSIADTSSEGRL